MPANSLQPDLDGFPERSFLPLIILYQLNFGFKLIVMPICTVIGFAVFWIGTQLREKA